MSSSAIAAGTSLAALDGSLERAITGGELELPLLPRVAGAVLALARDERSDAVGLCTLIRQDLALAGHVMRAANSPCYLARTRIVSLQQAIARLGMRTIGEISLAASVKAKVFRAPGHDARVALLWRHALASGAWGKEIARLRRRQVEQSFLCGLLHNIGKPVVLQALCILVENCRHRPTDAELDLLIARHHTRVGVEIARRWSLPAPVATSIEFWQRYAEAPRDRDQAAVTHCADRFATYLLQPGEMTEDLLRGLAACQDLNLYQDDIDALLAQRAAIEEMVEAISL